MSEDSGVAELEAALARMQGLVDDACNQASEYTWRDAAEIRRDSEALLREIGVAFRE